MACQGTTHGNSVIKEKHKNVLLKLSNTFLNITIILHFHKGAYDGTIKKGF